MKIAVVGANGFLGKEIVSKLLETEHEVLAIYNSNFEGIPAGAQMVQINEFLKGDFEIDGTIISAGNFSNSILENNKLNCEVVYPLTKKYYNSRFVYVSSANVYGTPSQEIKENSSFHNPNHYGLSKISGETIVSGTKNFAIVRPVYLYGKGLTNGSFLPFLIKMAKERKRIGLFGGGKRLQDYLHVSDAAELCIKSFFSGSEETIFLGAYGESVSNLKIANLICENLKTECQVVLLDKPEQSTSLFYNSSKTQQILGWRPKVDICTGIKEMLA